MADDLPVVVLDTLIIEPNSMLVRVEAVHDKVGNIFIPDVAVEKKEYAIAQGTVVKVGDFLWHFDQEITRPDEGDLVLFTRYSGTDVEGDDGLTYKLVHEKDVRMAWKLKEGRKQ